MGRISGLFEIVTAFRSAEEAADISDCFPEVIEGSGGGGAQMGLEFGERHLDRVEVGTVGRQEQEPGSFLLEAFGGPCAFVDGEVVEDDDVALREGRRELGLDPGVEGWPVDCLFDHPGRGQAVTAQAGDEGLRSPMAEWGVGVQPRAAPAAAAKPHHLCVDGGLIDEDQAMRFEPHPWLAQVGPDPALGADVLACAFRCHQRFFYM